MAIEIHCKACNKRYRVGDQMAGKRVKCKNCGAPITVPGVEDEALDELEESGVSGGESVADEQGAGGGENEALPQGFGAALQAARMRLVNRRFSFADYPGARLAHNYLPWLVGSLCGGFAIYIGVQMILNQREPKWPLATYLGLALLLFLVGIVPAAWRGIKTASMMLHFDLPPGTLFRVAGLFCLPLLLVAMLADSGAGIVFGCALGILMLMPLIWVSFQLHWVEAVVAWMMSSLFFAASTAVVAGIIFLVGLGVAMSTIPPPEPPKLVKGPATKPIDPPATQTVTVETPPTPPATQETAVVPPTPPATQEATVLTPPVTPPTPTPPTPDPGGLLGGLPPPPPPQPPVMSENTTPQPPPTPPKPETVRFEASAIVAAVKDVPFLDGAEQVLESDSAVAPLSVLKRTPETESIDIVSRVEDKSQGVASFKRDPQAPDRYVVSPEGDAVVRTITWPKLGVQTWIIAGNTPGRTTDLDSPTMTATPLCFLGNDTVLIQRTLGDKHGVQVWNVRTGQKVGRPGIDTPPLMDDNYAISPDGRMLAVASAILVRGAPQPTLSLVNLTTGQARQVPIPIDPRWPVNPAGVSFSPDSSRVAVLFEEQGNVLAIAWNPLSGVKMHEHVYPAGMLMLPPRQQFKGRAIHWLADNNSWVIFGTLLIDVPSGKVLGQFGVQRVTSQRVIDGKKLYLEAQLDSGAKRIARVVLNEEAINRVRPPAPAK